MEKTVRTYKFQSVKNKKYMYNKVECVMLQCDNCKEDYQNEHSGFSIFVDESAANDDADNDGWYLHGDDYKHYCPKCHTINDEDELVIDMTRTTPKV